MQALDHDYVNNLVDRLAQIGASAQPAWGRMTRDEMVTHLVRVVQYSMGKGPEFADHSTWFSRNVSAPLLLHGIISIPKNLPLPKPRAGEKPGAHPEDLETLHAVLENYLSLVQAGELNPPPHPFLGNIGVDGWARLHVLHFEHHLKQFGG
jgi:hypothetical protein